MCNSKTEIVKRNHNKFYDYTMNKVGTNVTKSTVQLRWPFQFLTFSFHRVNATGEVGMVQDKAACTCAGAWAEDRMVVIKFTVEKGT